MTLYTPRKRLLGCLPPPPKNDPRIKKLLRFADYAVALPPPPISVSWLGNVPSWGMLANDQVGDCTIAAALHLDMAWTAWASTGLVYTDAQALKVYEDVCGYVPGNEATDQGGVEIDVLNKWRTDGFVGRKIAAYVAISPKNHTHVQSAIDLFGGVYIGISLPTTADGQNANGQIWSPAWYWPFGAAAPGSWGGHAVPVLAYDPASLTCITWALTQTMNWSFWDKYVSECYAVLSSDWINNSGKSPGGFDLSHLTDDLHAVTNGA